MSQENPVRELRLALTVENYDEALRFYRDALGLPVLDTWDGPDGQGILLDAGRATLEVLSTAQARMVDRTEVGAEGVSGPVRLALEVADSLATAAALRDAGAEQLHEPVVTPWQHRNVRLRAPDGMQITLFTVLDSDLDSGML